MKGMILAGGMATRLRPLTLVTNKHLLPVYNKPMIYYAVESMQRAGIKEVLLITSGAHVGDFANLLQSGQEFGLRLYYSIQNNPKGGISDAIRLGKEFAKGENIIVLCGDGIFFEDMSGFVRDFEQSSQGALIFGMRMYDRLDQYGIIEMDENNRVLSIEEKPKEPKSNIVQTGIYIYDQHVFKYIDTLKPSARGELEVTDLNNIYLKMGQLKCQLIDWWVDAGTSYDELLRANNEVAKKYRESSIL